MKPLKDLKIIYAPYEEIKWPTEELLDAVERACYSEKSHCLFFVTDHTKTEWNREQTQEKFETFVEEIVDEHTEGIPQELEQALRKKAKSDAASAVKSKRKRKFIKTVTGGVKLDDALTAMDFLNGATTGGGNLNIRENVLQHYMTILIYRVAPDEFLLGRNLSGGGSNNSSCGARIASVIFQSSAKFWPSDLHYERPLVDMKPPEHYVLLWVLKRLRTIQVKYPTTVKHRASYEVLFGQTCKVLREAQTRWNASFEESELEEVQKMIDIFGDIPQMKEYNAGLRMRYEMTGEI